MARALYPGTFDPFTLGHLDIARRASQVFDHVEITVAEKPGKNTLLTATKRLELAQLSTADLPCIEVTLFQGLIADYARKQGVRVIVRGLRSLGDFDYECRMAHTNRQLVPELDTIFFHTAAAHALTSSSLVREILLQGGDIAPFVPRPVARELAALAGQSMTNN